MEDTDYDLRPRMNGPEVPLEERASEALASWQRWVRRAAACGELPPQIPFRHAAYTLGIADPVQAFDRDVDEYRKVRAWRLAAARAATAAKVAPRHRDGQRVVLSAQIRHLEAMAESLRLVSDSPERAATRSCQLIAEATRRNPRVFQSPTEWVADRLRPRGAA